MERQIVESTSLERGNKWASVINTKPRPLTHDERKAAEAAFQHEPFNPAWSQAARAVYEGLTGAMARSESCSLPLLHAEAQSEAVWDETSVS